VQIELPEGLRREKLVEILRASGEVVLNQVWDVARLLSASCRLRRISTR
jgi:hypothetical protein